MGEAEPKEQTHRTKVVLIVDDEEATRLLMKAAVESTGLPCQVLLAAEGDTALRLAQQTPPHLVLLDIVLPGSGTSGVLVCDQLSKDSRTKVVLVSGQSSKTIVQTCLAAGAIAYVPKPFDVTAVREQIRGWLSE